MWKGLLYKLYIPYFENTFKKTNELKYLQYYTYTIYIQYSLNTYTNNLKELLLIHFKRHLFTKPLHNDTVKDLYKTHKNCDYYFKFFIFMTKINKHYPFKKTKLLQVGNFHKANTKKGTNFGSVQSGLITGFLKVLTLI